jgi:hypothetical protein
MDNNMSPSEVTEQVTLMLSARMAQWLRRGKPLEMPMSQWLIVNLVAKFQEDKAALDLEQLARYEAKALADLALQRAAELLDVARSRAKKLAEDALCLCGSGKTYILCCALPA